MPELCKIGEKKDQCGYIVVAGPGPIWIDSDGKWSFLSGKEGGVAIFMTEEEASKVAKIVFEWLKKSMWKEKDWWARVYKAYSCECNNL